MPRAKKSAPKTPRAAPKKPKYAGGLTPRARKFVYEYLIDLNPVAGYMRAYPDVTRASAKTFAYQLMREPAVAAEIDAALSDMRERCLESVQAAIAELGICAFTRVTDLVDVTQDQPRLRPAHQIPPQAWGAVQSVTCYPWGVVIKFHNKVQALELMMNRLGLLQSLPPIEVLLLALPPELSSAVRAALAATLSSRSDPSSGFENDPNAEGIRADLGPRIHPELSGTDTESSAPGASPEAQPTP
jgi:hypothetical protein